MPDRAFVNTYMQERGFRSGFEERSDAVTILKMDRNLGFGASLPGGANRCLYRQAPFFNHVDISFLSFA